MPAAILTGEGQLTLPKSICDLLQVHPGDQVAFIVDDRGEVRVRAQRGDIRDLRGLLSGLRRKRISLEAMDDVIRSARAKRP